MTLFKKSILGDYCSPQSVAIGGPEFHWFWPPNFLMEITPLLLFRSCRQGLFSFCIHSVPKVDKCILEEIASVLLHPDAMGLQTTELHWGPTQRGEGTGTTMREWLVAIIMPPHRMHLSICHWHSYLQLQLFTRYVTSRISSHSSQSTHFYHTSEGIGKGSWFDKPQWLIRLTM